MKGSETNKYNMMEKILEIAFSGFWNFVGMLGILYMVFYFVTTGLVQIWARFMMMLVIRKHGWPPAHLDADGDLNKIEKE